MTGYGKSELVSGTKKITVEVKTLNSKQTDINLRLPSVYKEKELILRSLLAKTIGRGKAEMSVHIESQGEQSAYSINRELALEYQKQLQLLADDLGESNVTQLPLLLRMPDVLKPEKATLDEGEWKILLGIAEEALGGLNEFREQEGAILQQDFTDRISIIQSLLQKILAIEGERIQTVRERIDKNLREFVDAEQIDQNRFEQELIYYLEKFDITEEKVRLKAHCDYFIETLTGPEGQGKKLGFISQEIGREINTIGSKANHVGIQKMVVQMKDELEKIKEQVLNVL